MSSGRKKRGGRPGDDGDVLDLFLPPVASWFRSTLGEPTAPQRQGWRSISAGKNTLIAAPTGSGKSLAAFLAALDLLWRQPARGRGVRILYISPLKALNADVHRNLQVPLAGILEEAEASGTPLRALSAAVRSGDTPASERARILRKPPEILIITPESLHLMLTSQARETLREVSHVVVDEIHAVCGDKRGVFLALLLERLEALGAGRAFVRIGLSATQKPLEEVARYLGGLRPTGSGCMEFRPVEIVDASAPKSMDLRVIWPGGDGGLGPPGSIWPAIEDQVLGMVEEHRSTLVFANNRRTVEKLTARLNELAARDVERDTSNDSETDPEPGPFRAHHGSLSLEERRTTEEMLKNASLRAVVSTASLELGIDMGEVDLVCQVESPGNVARGLQRVGRSGHLVGGTSRGRLIAKTPSDLLESAALAKAMLAGDIEPLRVPRNCLDVLAQQVVACAAVDRWEAPALYDLVRRAYPFSDLPAEAFERVLMLVSGRYSTGSIRDLRARIVWDRIHNRLAPLPGTSRLALTGGGTIPDVGHYPVYLGEGGPKLGELDEEFVFERRVGESFMLGNSAWRIDVIDVHKVLVSPAGGSQVVMPFWRGETSPRSMELGRAVGGLTRVIAEHLDDPSLPRRLEEECRVEPPAARFLIRHVGRQRRLAGMVPDDRTVLVETFRDPAGETALAVLSPYGRMHLGLKLALLARIQDRLGMTASCLHGDDGLLFRLPGTDDPPLDILEGLDGAEAERLIRRVLPDTALFGLRFRQNAGRALLMPRPDPTKRTPLWLQRLRAKDLLGVVGAFPDHPIVVETFRECLDDDLLMPRLREFLDAIAAGTIRVEKRAAEVASPFASDLVFQFTAAYLYEWDEPRRKPDSTASAAVDEGLLDGLLHGLEAGRGIDEQAVGRLEARLRGRGRPPRTADEMAETLRTLGDLAPTDLSGPMEAFAIELEGQGRAERIDLPGVRETARWILAEEVSLYKSAFGDHPSVEDIATIVRRFLRTHALVGLADVLGRYPIAAETARGLLEEWVESSGVVRVEQGEDGPLWADPENLAEVQRLTIAQRRRESVAVAPEVFADFVARRQHVHPAERLSGVEGVEVVLDQLQGFAGTAQAWEEELLPRRVVGFTPAMLDEILARGGWSWRAWTEGAGEPTVTLVTRDFGGGWPSEESVPLTDAERAALDALGLRGASFAADLARGANLDQHATNQALRSLMRRGLVRNDRFDPLRPGAFDVVASAARGGLRRGRSRRLDLSRPEGRWEVVPEADPDPERRALTWIDALFARFGVLARETVASEPWAAPWSELYPHLARLELRGEIRRGYFVEGLSGVQYATEEAAETLGTLAASTGQEEAEVMLAASDSANLYGSGAPLDVPLLEGGSARLLRSPGNFLVLRGGRPVLIIEAYGRRLTGLASASREELDSALARVLDLVSPERRVFKVETYNGEPTLASPAAGRLAQLGFVRDYPAMTYYAAWSAGGI
ncbi:DEAD/DEAH box helicase [Paludisphaera rhizosphaerae]|uniref:DEAD/DEAH box helicase n=1 Tax=Paludisphaera rhizosphaerae TaxID=2711216 RepID=UPI0013EE1D46|nr:DEAD/DEAH box helicase [Paludisphaera rhizosphaerae]